PFRTLQQHDADHGGDDEQMDDDDERLHVLSKSGPCAKTCAGTVRHIGVARLSTRSPAAFPPQLRSPHEASRSDAKSGSDYAEPAFRSAACGLQELSISRCNAEKIIRLEAGAAH